MFGAENEEVMKQWITALSIAGNLNNVINTFSWLNWSFCGIEVRCIRIGGTFRYITLGCNEDAGLS